ncbi:MAG TPA: hypothetical protein VF446_10045 [Trinickia sp.]
MKIVRTVFQVTLFLICGSLLTGCDKTKEMDSEVAATKQQIADLKGEVTASKQQIADLKADLTEVRAKMAALEADQKKGTNNDEQQSLPPERIAALNKAIAQCVTRVRASAPTGQEEFYVRFDAYYNPGNGRVMNNVRYNGEAPALYMFNKCMASQGFPLS